MMRIPLKGGDEYDALTRARRWYIWRAGDRARAKRAYARRVRRWWRLWLRQEGEAND